MEVLGHLYALAAAHISDDPAAIRLILADVPVDARAVMPEAALAIAYTSVRTFRDGDDPFDDPAVAALPSPVLDALASILAGDTPDAIPLYDDPVKAAILTVGTFWLWAAHGQPQEALRIARRHCANMALYRDERTGTQSRDDEEGWN